MVGKQPWKSHTCTWSETKKMPPDVQVEHKTWSTICERPVKAFMDQKMTGLAGGGSGKVKILPWMGLASIYFWPRSPLEGPKWIKDPWNAPQMVPPDQKNLWNIFWSHSTFLTHLHRNVITLPSFLCRKAILHWFFFVCQRNTRMPPRVSKLLKQFVRANHRELGRLCAP